MRKFVRDIFGRPVGLQKTAIKQQWETTATWGN